VNRLSKQSVQLELRMLLPTQQLQLLDKGEHESNCKQIKIIPKQKGRLSNVDLCLLELPMLVLQ
jgi:hypothetical protein